MHPSRTQLEMKDSHLIMDIGFMNYRIIKVGGDIRRPLVQCHDQSKSSIEILSSFEIMSGPFPVILSTSKDGDLKPLLGLSSSA